MSQWWCQTHPSGCHGPRRIPAKKHKQVQHLRAATSAGLLFDILSAVSLLFSLLSKTAALVLGRSPAAGSQEASETSPQVLLTLTVWKPQVLELWIPPFVLPLASLLASLLKASLCCSVHCTTFLLTQTDAGSTILFPRT